MGTSSSYPGPGRGSPLLPPWADEDWEGVPTDEADTQLDEHPEQAPDQKVEQGEEQYEDDKPSQPVTINLGPARRHIRQYASGAGLASLALAAGAYVAGMGGARNAARSARAGRSATRRLGGFLSNVATRGVEAALDRLELGHLVGSSVETVLAAVEDVLAPDGASIDEAAARNAMSATLKDLYQLYSLDDEDIYGLNAMDAEGVRSALHLYVTNYIYERLLNVMQEDLGSQDLSEQQLIRAEHEIRSFTRETVKLELGNVDVLTVNWNGRQGERIVSQVYEQGYAIWEAMQS
jgi:hypothetical protein